MKVKIPRLVIAGLSGDSGKTLVSLALLAALKKKGLRVIPFKKGPDYIDAAWLGSVSGIACRNLDTWLVDAAEVRTIFTSAATGANLALVEGNRGLFDGKDVLGSHSTAGLAALLQAPLVLVINAAKATRTVAALVQGCQNFDGNPWIAGVILNRLGGRRHEKIITEAIDKYCGLPVLGTIPRLGNEAALLPGRHLGLVPPAEFSHREEIDHKLLSIAENSIDIDKVLETAALAPDLPGVEQDHHAASAGPVNIGYFFDEVFTFYYPENLEALQRLGARLVPIRSLTDERLPQIDALYIGGGFPETHGERLAQNRPLAEAVKQAAADGAHYAAAR